MDYSLIILFLIYFITVTIVLTLGYLNRKLKSRDLLGTLVVSFVFIVVYYVSTYILALAHIKGLNIDTVAYIAALWGTIIASDSFWSRDIAREKNRMNMMFIATLITVVAYSILLSLPGVF